MASYPAWSELSRKQRKLALKRWHERQDGTAPAAPKANPADSDPLYDPTVTLAGGALKNAINEIVRGQFRPAEKALDRQAKTTRQQGSALAARVAGYSGDVDKRADVAQARQDAIAERLGQALAGVGAQAQAQAGQVQAAEGAHRQADVAMQAAPADAPNRAAEELAAIRARSAADTNTAGTSGALASADFAGLANTTRMAQQLHGSEVQGQLANRLANDLAEIRAKRADLGTLKGTERTKQLLGLRQSGFENLITAKGLGIKETELAADIEARRKELELARRKQRQAESETAFDQGDKSADNAREDQKVADAEARDHYQQQHKVGPYKPAASKSPAQESADARKLKIGVTNAAADAKDLLTGTDKNGNKRSVARVQEILRKRGAPPIVILAATDLAQYGFVTPAHLKSLRIAGLHIPKSWRAPRVHSQGATDHPVT